MTKKVAEWLRWHIMVKIPQRIPQCGASAKFSLYLKGCGVRCQYTVSANTVLCTETCSIYTLALAHEEFDLYWTVSTKVIFVLPLINVVRIAKAMQSVVIRLAAFCRFIRWFTVTGMLIRHFTLFIRVHPRTPRFIGGPMLFREFDFFFHRSARQYCRSLLRCQYSCVTFNLGHEPKHWEYKFKLWRT